MKTIFMPKKHLDTWLSALRSGEYKQGEGKLQEGNDRLARYCCLGVLQKAVSGSVSYCNTLPEMDWLDEFGITFKSFSALAARQRTPSVMYNDGTGYGDDTFTLDGLNDEQHLSFTQIAELIEQHAEVLEEGS